MGCLSELMGPAPFTDSWTKAGILRVDCGNALGEKNAMVVREGPVPTTKPQRIFVTQDTASFHSPVHSLLVFFLHIITSNYRLFLKHISRLGTR